MKLNPFNEDFGSRLWGMSVVLWMLSIFWIEYPVWARIISTIVFTYFAYFGNTRFGKEYKKII